MIFAETLTLDQRQELLEKIQSLIVTKGGETDEQGD